MANLSLLQSQFQDYLIHSDPQNILWAILPDERFSAQNRLKIYHDAYRLRLLEILRLDFPKTHTLMGDEEFDKAFFLYLDAYPSKHFSVRYFGQHFAHFLEQTLPYKDYGVLAEMANFEWAISHTIDALDAPIVTTEQFASLSNEDWLHLRFELHPSVISHLFYWDVPLLWQIIDKEEPPQAPTAQQNATRWLFWRKGLKSYFQSCTQAQDKMFCSAKNKDPFLTICENLMDIVPEDQIPLLTAQTLNKWVGEQMISRIWIDLEKD